MEYTSFPDTGTKNKAERIALPYFCKTTESKQRKLTVVMRLPVFILCNHLHSKIQQESESGDKQPGAFYCE